MRRSLPTLASVLLGFAPVGCAIQPSNDGWWDELSPAEAAADEPGHVAAGVLGIDAGDYPRIATAASEGDIGALQQVQRVTGHGDGAGSLGQSLLIQKLLEAAGDSVFATALSTQSQGVILAHQKFLDPRLHVSILPDRFPLTYGVIKNARFQEPGVGLDP